MDKPIHVNRDQVTIGVFSEAQISAGLGQGSITPNDLCWTEGMKEWKTIREAYPHLSPSASAAPPSGIPLMPSRPGQPSANYASGGDRFGAYLLDGLFMGLISCGLIVPVVIVLVVSADTDIAQMAQAFRSAANLIGVFVGCFISLLYYGIQGNSPQNATWGQRIMGFKMVDSKTGAAPQSGQVWKWAMFRSLILSCCSCIGWLFFIPILNHAKKQSSFDEWADILMVKK